MKKGKKLKFIIFLFYTYCISQSVIPAMLIANSQNPVLEDNTTFLLEFSLGCFFQVFLFPQDLYDDKIFFTIILPLLMLLYEVVILFWPFYLYWRKRTVFRAWLVAIAGCFTPGYLIIYFSGSPGYYLAGILIMTAGYIITALILRYLKRRKLQTGETLSNN